MVDEESRDKTNQKSALIDSFSSEEKAFLSQYKINVTQVDNVLVFSRPALKDCVEAGDSALKEGGGVQVVDATRCIADIEDLDKNIGCGQSCGGKKYLK